MTNEHLYKICGFGQKEETCAYLVSGSKGFFCAKTDASLIRTIEARRPFMAAQGDNCEIDPNIDIFPTMERT